MNDNFKVRTAKVKQTRLHPSVHLTDGLIFLFVCVLLPLNLVVRRLKAMVGTGEALLNIRTKGGPAAQADGKGAASVPTAQEFDFQSELQKFDKVNI